MAENKKMTLGAAIMRYCTVVGEGATAVMAMLKELTMADREWFRVAFLEMGVEIA